MANTVKIGDGPEVIEIIDDDTDAFGDRQRETSLVTTAAGGGSGRSRLLPSSA